MTLHVYESGFRGGFRGGSCLLGLRFAHLTLPGSNQPNFRAHYFGMRIVQRC